ALLWIVPLKILLLGLLGQFRGVFYFFRLYDAIRMVAALAIATVVVIFMGVFLHNVPAAKYFSIPRSIALIDFNLSLIIFVGFRVGIRTLRHRLKHSPSSYHGPIKRIAIIGAGNAGEQLAADLISRRATGIEPVCFLDDAVHKHGLEIHGIPIVGSPDVMPSLREKYGVTEVILALPSQGVRRIRQLSNLALESGLKVLVVPSMSELAGGRVRANDLRPVSVEDLLGREPAKLDDTAIDQLIHGRTVLVTGAGGSIGQAGAIITPIIADVTDRTRMEEIFQRFRPELVLHAAAHKHVPMMESQPGEALKNNTLGTALVAELASNYQVKEFVLISTDKAINPTNVMGASKRLAEIAVQSMQTRPGNLTRFVAVRFGNVLGSSGSVIPMFKKQIAAGGPVTVTHPDVQRYFMTIPEAVGLVLQSATQGRGGDILVLEMGQPLKIIDVARQLIELSGFRPDIDIEIKITGLRPGEKMIEELQHHGEQHHPTAHPRIFRFVGPAMDNAKLPEFLQAVKQCISQEKDICKQGIRQLVPEYIPFVD
ncbi:MAG: nucleoside-diphosphate sugar epimerase/dehydratase, partial [Proteobacteria bacterium]|nr:nucleoside-diphosphate sugar epimerase/dehydratase [Pseudomonadota bacterium]